jgi:hypothetical protein
VELRNELGYRDYLGALQLPRLVIPSRASGTTHDKRDACPLTVTVAVRWLLHEIPILTPPIGRSIQEDTTSSDLGVVVVYTTPELTKQALHYAAKLGKGLRVHVRLVEIEVVPFPCPLDQPRSTSSRSASATISSASLPLDTSVRTRTPTAFLGRIFVM